METVRLSTKGQLVVPKEFRGRHRWEAGMEVLGLGNGQIERAEQVAGFLSWFEQGMDFADALHLALAAGAGSLVTSDQRYVKAAMAQGLPVQSLWHLRAREPRDQA